MSSLCSPRGRLHGRVAGQKVLLRGIFQLPKGAGPCCFPGGKTASNPAVAHRQGSLFGECLFLLNSFFFFGGGGLFILVLVLFWPFVGVGAEDGSGRHPRGPFTERRAPWVTPRPSCPLRGLVEEGWDRPLLAFIAFL